MLVIAVLPVAVLVALLLAQPHFIGGHEGGPLNTSIGAMVLFGGATLYAIGLGWMIRIYRTTLDAECRSSSWRSRSR